MCGLLSNTSDILNQKPLGQSHYLSGISIRKQDMEANNNPEWVELSQTMLQKILLVDYSNRNISLPVQAVASAPSDSDATNVWDLLGEESSSESSKEVHPIDIFLFLYLSSDALFQRKILQKLAKCKLSLPLIVNDPSTCEPKLLAFPFQSLSSEWKKGSADDKAKESILFNEPMPVFSFIRVGEPTSDKFSKSQMLNDILGLDHDCFMHRNSPGSINKRLLFDGTVELSWFLPRKGSQDKFANPIVFLNLRGNALSHLKQLNFIQLISNKIFLLFWSGSLKESDTASLKNLYDKSGSKIVCLFTNATAEAKSTIRSCPNVRGDLEHVVVLGKDNRAKDIENLCRLINLHSQDPAEQLSSLADHIENANHGLEIDYNELHFKESELETDLIMKPLLLESSENNPNALRLIKDKYFPLQGKPWGDWSLHHTESVRLKKCHDTNLEEYRSELRDLMNECRNQQIQILNGVSNMNFLYDILKICRFSFIKPFYSELFWNKLQLSLDKICTQHLPHLYEEHNELSKLKNNPTGRREPGPYSDLTESEINSKFHESARNLSKSSLGFEHIIRELSQVFEAYISASDEQRKVLDKRLPIEVEKLPMVAANLLLQGYPLEILDGDVSNVPTTWLSHVLQQLKSIVGNKRIYIISILGVQSSGKSTLLNTMFGLHFAVSAGRCTKGVFMQMIPVSEDLSDSLGYDYLVVLDTEGLRAPELDSDVTRFHDNELATFAIGLSNLAIINIMGENPTDMEDILQITVNAFLRMNLTWIRPRCIFVHQNVTSLLSGDKLAPARNALISKLNEMTKVAAKHENMPYKYFTDIIQFDPDEDVLYFPSLYKGNPPMAPVNENYSFECFNLKSKILKISNNSQRKLSSLGVNIVQLWNAILHENFVFHFKNIQEINAQRDLDNAISEWYYGYMQCINAWQLEILTKLSNSTHIDEMLSGIELEVRKLCLESFKNEELSLVFDFFESNEKSDLFNQWESRTKDHFDEIRRVMQKETLEKFYTQYELILNQLKFFERTQEIEEDLVTQVKQFVKKVVISETFDENKIYASYNTFWQNWERSLKFEQSSIEESDIATDLHNYLTSSRDFSHCHTHLRRRVMNTSNYYLEGRRKFRIYYKHFTIDCDFDSSFLYNSVMKAIMSDNIRQLDYDGRKVFNSLHYYLHQIADACKDFLLKLPPNINYNKNYFLHFSKIISDEITLINQHKLKSRGFAIHFTEHFKLEMVFYQCCKAIPTFEHLQRSYIDYYSIERQLRTLKERYYLTFRHAVEVTQSEKACSSHLADIIIEGMKTYLVPQLNTIAVQNFASDRRDILRSKGTVQLGILRDAINDPKFERFLHYIRNPNICMPKWIRQQFFTYIHTEVFLSKVEKQILEKVNSLTAFYIKSANSASNANTWPNWKSTFHSKIFLKINSLRLGALTVLDAYDVKNFKQLAFYFQTDIKTKTQGTNWRSWAKSNTNTNSGALTQLIQTRMNCPAMCPFCGEPCQLSIGNHEKHYCGSLHRVDAVNGGREHLSQQMYLYECTICVRDGHRFLYRGNFYYYDEMQKVDSVFRSWNISADDAKESKYWQWFTYQFQDRLARHYKYKVHPNVSIWKNISKQEVLQDLSQHYQQFLM